MSLPPPSPTSLSAGQGFSWRKRNRPSLPTDEKVKGREHLIKYVVHVFPFYSVQIGFILNNLI